MRAGATTYPFGRLGPIPSSNCLLKRFWWSQCLWRRVYSTNPYTERVRNAGKLPVAARLASCALLVTALLDSSWRHIGILSLGFTAVLSFSLRVSALVRINVCCSLSKHKSFQYALPISFPTMSPSLAAAALVASPFQLPLSQCSLTWRQSASSFGS